MKSVIIFLVIVMLLLLGCGERGTYDIVDYGQSLGFAIIAGRGIWWLINKIGLF